MALSDPPHNPTEAQELFKTSLTADVIHNREIPFPPNVGYHPVPPHTFDRSPFDLELAYASSASVSGLMAALPQWNLDPAPEAVDTKPWRVIWPYHPILNTWRYVPTGAGQPYTGPSEWAPVMVHIAASLLWPDLPFLVTSPDYILGAQASLSELRRCLGYPLPPTL